ncbi:PhzF family phenazine biosynthesis protein [Rufibacter glacialis]|uniref:PhzF family phenazine biosynthesis protein n=1 Tax=Rufibacter glacialis TaxID=1259555 RepID=A0A5M8QB78_9BACT|nr:PhzF family phenazine biosynthesis protein [Rufibacter glacialis]KAA6431772.1 PhzF family phenazine biosynthesis protein [Rufibacter glacialis]GGK81687.1 hypothetical protein GCM10011405_31880 [Rufibacter glacialis]
MNIKTYIVDAFTTEAFKGNPAGVCLLEEPLADGQMQAIAAELNLSETAFLRQQPEQVDKFDIRFFTPTVEMAFCGHATLASAKVVLDKIGLSRVTFRTHQNLVLQATKEKDNILMQFPLYGYQPLPHQPLVSEALGLPSTNHFYFAEEIQMLLLEVPDKATLLQITPDFPRLVKALDTVNGLAVTTKSEDQEYDFYTRCFWPWVGINEDPVTGSAHSALARFWADRLQKTELKAFQLSARGGFLHLKLKNDNILEVRSQAQIVLEGTLFLT